MLRFGLLFSVFFLAPALMSQAEPRRNAPSAERSAERFLNGTDADRDAMLKETAKIIANNGYTNIAVVPWFVMMATNKKGAEVLLLVDPVKQVAVEIDTEPGKAETATASPRR